MATPAGKRHGIEASVLSPGPVAHRQPTHPLEMNMKLRTSEPVARSGMAAAAWHHLTCSMALTAVAASLATPPAHALAVLATDDTTLVQDRPAESRVAWTFMQPGPGRQALMSFPIGDALAAATTADDIQRAVLVASVITIGTPGSLEVLLLNGPFSEAANPTYATRPPYPAAGSGVKFALDKGQLRPYYVDITRLVREARAAGRRTVDLLIQPALETPGAAVEMWSRESGTFVPWTPATRPQLDITIGAQAPALLTLWTPSTGSYSCQSVCNESGLIAVATPQGAVCKDGNGITAPVENRVPDRPSGTVIYYHFECGSANGLARTAQCACARK